MPLTDHPNASSLLFPNVTRVTLSSTQSPRPRRHDTRGWPAAPVQRRAGPLPDAAHRLPNRVGHGLPGLAALRPPGLGYSQLPGGQRPPSQDRRLRHVKGHLQQRLLQGKWARLFHFVKLWEGARPAPFGRFCTEFICHLKTQSISSGSIFWHIRLPFFLNVFFYKYPVLKV